jgi:hypothetical protein
VDESGISGGDAKRELYSGKGKPTANKLNTTIV